MNKARKNNNDNAKVKRREAYIKAFKNSATYPEVRPYELLDSLDFSYPNKTEEQKEKILKTAENNAEFLYSLLRNEYKRRNEEVFQEAINALDQMKEKYMTLKAKKLSINELLEITQKWFLYLHSIEVMIAHITSDSDLLRSVEELDPAHAKVLSKEILSDFEVKLKVAKLLGL